MPYVPYGMYLANYVPFSLGSPTGTPSTLTGVSLDLISGDSSTFCARLDITSLRVLAAICFL